MLPALKGKKPFYPLTKEGPQKEIGTDEWDEASKFVCNTGPCMSHLPSLQLNYLEWLKMAGENEMASGPY